MSNPKVMDMLLEISEILGSEVREVHAEMTSVRGAAPPNRSARQRVDLCRGSLIALAEQIRAIAVIIERSHARERAAVAATNVVPTAARPALTKVFLVSDDPARASAAEQIKAHIEQMSETELWSVMAAARWPGGYMCPACGERCGTAARGGRAWRCGSCGDQAAIARGTAMYRTSLSIHCWFLVCVAQVIAPDSSTKRIGDWAGVRRTATTAKMRARIAAQCAACNHVTPRAIAEVLLKA